ncbi:hypothetical protein Q4Q54_05025 [Shewanella sp. SP2S2-4]|uniref:hypothetical protein n=1 Tax=Shewanella sp. SP2S2-4 TaxID=3063539 RepID=UPI00288D3E56|nr:hypothetical protein [Shewanella sp. SP2S2-4]MDT3272847.1 hypothetical protein [Shewanella sp. SP2S2-4]
MSLFRLRKWRPIACLFVANVIMPYNLAAAADLETKTLPSALLKQVNQLVDTDTPRLEAMFKDLHQHPEIAFTEVRTAAIVVKELKALGFTVTEGIGKTGVVGVLKNGSGPTVWFRADMDANSVKEATGLSYAAKNKQRLPDGSEIDVMHACGHDAHVTCHMDAWHG